METAGQEVARQQEVATGEANQAELEDCRRQDRKEIEDHEAAARGAILLDFLEIADTLERATAAWKEGGGNDLKSAQAVIDSVSRLLHLKLGHYAVTAFEAEGKPFDPRVHHAVSRSTSTDTTPGTVLCEVQKGYLMGEQLLRPAAVVVASGPAMTREDGTSAEEPGTGDDPASDWHAYLRNRR